MLKKRYTTKPYPRLMFCACLWCYTLEMRAKDEEGGGWAVVEGVLGNLFCGDERVRL